jgi:hypothetical protein
MKKSIALVVALTAIIAVNCKKDQSTANNAEVKGYLVFLKGNVYVNEKEAVLRGQVKQNDVIRTDKKSAATIQFAESAVVKLQASTQLEVSKLAMGTDKPDIALLQKKGSTFNKIVKGQADYHLSTPTAVAGVRGTSFSVSVSKDNTTEVQLLKGRVEVKTTSATQEAPVILEEGKKVLVEEDAGIIKVSKVEELKKDEAKELTVENKVEVLSQPEIQKFIAETPKEGEVEKVEKEAPRKLTLEDLKAQYGRLSKIILKSGQTYIGAFQQKGAEMIIITVDGRFVHKPSDIEKVLPHN